MSLPSVLLEQKLVALLIQRVVPICTVLFKPCDSTVMVKPYCGSGPMGERDTYAGTVLDLAATLVAIYTGCWGVAGCFQGDSSSGGRSTSRTLADAHNVFLRHIHGFAAREDRPSEAGPRQKGGPSAQRVRCCCAGRLP